MFFPVDPVPAIQSATSIALGYVTARGLAYQVSRYDVTSSGLLPITEGFNLINFSSGLSLTGFSAQNTMQRFLIYNRGNPVTLVNLSNAVLQSQRMILPSGANTVLGNNQWAEFFFDGPTNSWRVML